LLLENYNWDHLLSSIGCQTTYLNINKCIICHDRWQRTLIRKSRAAVEGIL